MRQKRKRVKVEAILGSFSPPPDIFVLQETNLLPGGTFKLSGYKPYVNDTTEAHDRGLITLVRESIRSEKVGRIDIGNNVENLVVRIETARYTVYICNVYKHSRAELDANKLTSETLIKHRADPTLPASRLKLNVFTGDFNAHHACLGDETDRTGKLLLDKLEESNLVLLNDDTPTHQSGTRIDWTIVHQLLAPRTDWRVAPEIASDHYATVTCINIERVKAPPPPIRHNFKKARWEEFETRMDESFSVVNTDLSLEDRATRFTQTIAEITDLTVPKSSGKCNPNCNYRWYMCPTVREALDRLQRFRRIQRIAPNLQHLEALRKCEYETRELLDYAKSEQWYEWCCKLTPHTPLVDIWKQIHRATGKKRAYSAPHPYPARRADHFIDMFVSRADGSESTPTSRRILRQLAPGRLKRFNKACNEPADTDYPITSTELDLALRKTKNTAPGIDNVRGIQLKHMGGAAKTELLAIFNLSYAEGRLAMQWKEACIAPIPKPKQPDGARPISLLSVPSKTMERVILPRWNYVLGRPPPSVFGYNPEVGTREALCALMSQLDAIEPGPKLVIFLDLNKAFEYIDRLSTLDILIDRGMKGRLLAWVGDYLYQRRAHVRFQGCKSKTRYFRRGTPQGGVLGPRILNVNMEELLAQRYPLGTFLTDFADDLILVITGWDLYGRAQRCLDIMGATGDKRGYKFGVPDKTDGMLVDAQSKPQQALYIHDEAIGWVIHHQCLGVWVDNRLTFRYHINYVLTRARQRLNALRILANCQQGATYTVLLMYYNMAIRSLFDYCAPVLATLTAKELAPLQKLQNAAMRHILGAPMWTRIVNMEHELRLLPVDLRVKDRQAVTVATAIKRDIRPLRQTFEELLTRDRRIWPEQGWGPSIADATDALIDCEKLLKYGPDINLHSGRQPWKPLRAMFWLDPYSSGRKADTSPQYLKTVAEERVRAVAATADTVYFTDGSVTEDGAGGFGVVRYPNYTHEPQLYESEARRTTDGPSTMQTEIAAIYTALSYEAANSTPSGPERSIVIASDSLSGLQALQNLNPPDNKYLITATQKCIDRLANNNTRAILVYVPSHVGVRGNELADKAASLGTSCAEEAFEIPPSLSQIKRRIKTAVQTIASNRREELLASSPTASWYNDAAANLPPVPPKLPRRDQVNLHRLRLGYRCSWEINARVDRDCVYCERTTDEPLLHYILECTITRSVFGTHLETDSPNADSIAAKRVSAAYTRKFPRLLKLIREHPPPR